MTNESDSKVGNLEDEALKRKERLNALKRGSIKKISSDNPESEDTNDPLAHFPKPIFRNYTPKDEELKPGVLPKPNLIEIENEIKEQLASGKPQPLIEKEIDLTTLAPQKIDWDLKRDAEKRLRVLEKRTQKAIVELIKERMKAQKNTDFAELISVGTRDMSLKNNEGKQDDSKREDSESDEDEDEAVADDESVSARSPESPFEINNKTEISDEDEY